MPRHALTPFCSRAGAVTILAIFAVGCNGGSSTVPVNGGSAATPSPVPLPVLFFPSPFSGLTVANNDTVTLFIAQQ